MNGGTTVASHDRAPTKPGRNEPCWCGSGRKYKKCCGTKTAESPSGPDVDWLFAEAQRELKRGGLERAGQLLADVLAADPRHAGALHGMGVLLATQTGRYGQAVELIRKAIALSPAEAIYHSNLGCALPLSYVPGTGID